MEDAPRYGLNIKKGEKGFLPVPDETKKKHLIAFKLTDAMKDTIQRYSTEHGLSKSHLINQALKHFFDSHNVPIVKDDNSDPNQLEIDV